MKRAKRATIYVAAGLFVAAAAAKLLFPARTSETIRTVEESFHRADYRTEETVAGVTEAADDAAMPVTVTINAAEFLGLTEPAGTEELSPAVEEAMAAFMEEQQPFVDLGVPANVSYDAPMPKFSFVQPLSARVSSDFGYRLHPIDNETKFHYGMGSRGKLRRRYRLLCVRNGDGSRRERHERKVSPRGARGRLRDDVRPLQPDLC